MSLAQYDESVPRQSLALWWLGQAGFAVKTPAGKVIYIDPSLTNVVERVFGFKRLALPAVTADEVRADLLLFTHEHYDHLDPDALPTIIKNNPGCRYAGPSGCIEGMKASGIVDAMRLILEPSETYNLEGVKVQATRAAHGDLSESALSLALEIDGIRMVFTGDTAYCPQNLKPICQPRPDILIPCINGGFGNMTPIDAARLVGEIQPRYAIPCHFWTFADQGSGDPTSFIHACRTIAPQVEAMLLRPGERIVCQRGI